MRLTCAIFSLVVGLTACVEASKEAGAYQVMFLWNAYQVEIETLGPGKTVTARDCNLGLNRACTFDEFIKHIELKRNTKGGLGTAFPTGVGATRELPIVQTAELLKARIPPYSAILDPAQLYPSRYDPKVQQPPLATLLGHSFTAIQVARGATTNPDGIARFVTLSSESLDKCVAFRRADLEASLITNLNKLMASKDYSTNFDIEYKNPKPTLPNGATYDEVDHQATLAKPKNKANPAAAKAFDTFVNGYSSVKPGLSHSNAIIALRGLSTDLKAPHGSCT